MLRRMTEDEHDVTARPAPFPWVTFVVGVVALLAWMAVSNIDEHGYARSDRTRLLSPWWLVVGWT